MTKKRKKQVNNMCFIGFSRTKLVIRNDGKLLILDPEYVPISGTIPDEYLKKIQNGESIKLDL